MARENRFGVAECSRPWNEIVQRCVLWQPNIVQFTRRELWMIEDVIGVGPELQAELIPNPEAFYQAHIEVINGSEAEVIAAAIRECSQASTYKGGVRIVGKISYGLSLRIVKWRYPGTNSRGTARICEHAGGIETAAEQRIDPALQCGRRGRFISVGTREVHIREDIAHPAESLLTDCAEIPKSG